MKAIGLMSGTSLDGVDVALIETDGETIEAFGPGNDFSYDTVEGQLLREALASAVGIANRADRSGVLTVAETMVTQKHIACVKAFASIRGLNLSEIDVIGFHGQTVVHKPEKGLTVQIGDGRGIAESLGVPVVYDFRAADMEEGGQGAPFAPIYHRALALRAGLALPAVFVNIGGISNISYIPEGGGENIVAFDAGPGNCLIDDWTLRHTGKPYDEDAKLALSGKVNGDVLQKLLHDPFLTQPVPKSLDRLSFKLKEVEGLSPADGAATLTAFTVACIAASRHFLPERAKTWIICGGGAHNPYIMAGLQRVLGAGDPAPLIQTADEAGFSTNFMEAQAFAFLAVRRLKGLPASFPKTTGASGPVVGGIIAEPETAKS
ncbi:protein of unknown function UPF0075 [Rhodomicrobium vannielii ATCC 17100]|uniref:Anhydro-N-acetylmuramic acid kinase n=2 Tax=Rhodomicrobium vannielii TaxID=1069 RepID=E3I509_RHOVT|nr:anhydro-N-acetylmuramic acid kinase [Rhodomicrobium vannielii]ADP69363.1 protein of unknown function UPF0075 [Rhodomicrobium vannielii ATCC 17100]